MFADLVNEAWETADQLLSNGHSMMQNLSAKQEGLKHSEAGLNSEKSEGHNREESAEVSTDRDEWEPLWRKQQGLWRRSKKLQDMSLRDP